MPGGDIAVLNKAGYHVSIVDPEWTYWFTEFHITFENNVEGRQAHFYYNEYAKYDKSHENDKQNQDYKADVVADGKLDVNARKNLASFDTLKGQADVYADAFLKELEAAEEKEKQRKKEEQEQKEAETDAAQGINGLQLTSKLKPQPEGKSVWGAKPVAYTQQEADAYKQHIISKMPNTALKRAWLKENGKYMLVDIKLQNYKAEGAKALREANADKSLTTATVLKVKWP